MAAIHSRFYPSSFIKLNILKEGPKGLLEALRTCGKDRYVCHSHNQAPLFQF